MEYRLPSGGLFYPAEQKTIKIKSFSYNTEEVLLSNFSGPEKVDKIVSLVTDLPEGFSPSDLVTGDQLFILAVARALTYNETYDFSSSCACGKTEKHSLKVPDQLPVKLWTKNDEEVGDAFINIKSFRFQLPASKDTIEIRYPTMAETAALTKWAESRKAHKLSGPKDDPTAMRRVCLHIKSINGTAIESSDYEDVEKWLKDPKFSGADFVTLRSKMEDNDCGITQKWTINCDSCGAVYVTTIPINYNFFRRD